jgi:hypothetical protein
MCCIIHKLSMPEPKSLSIEMVQTLKKYGEFAPWLEVDLAAPACANKL